MKVLNLVNSNFEKNNEQLEIFILCILLKLCVESLNKFMYSLVLNGDISFFIFSSFIISGLLQIYLTPLICIKLEHINQYIFNYYKQTELKFYRDKISDESKETFLPNEFNKELDTIFETFGAVICWFVPNIINCIVSLLFSIMVLRISNMWFLILFICLHILCYKYIYVNTKREMYDKENSYMKFRDKNNSKINLYLYDYNIDSTSYKDIEKVDINNQNSLIKFFEDALYANNTFSYINYMCLFILYVFIEKDLKNILISLFLLSDSIIDLIRTISWLTKKEIQINDYIQKKTKFVIRDKPYQKLLKDRFIITQIDMKRKDRKLYYCSLSNDLTINRTDKILVVGSSGNGKTTFIKGLTGQLEGIFIDGRPAIEYMDNFFVIGQSSYYKMNFTGLTLRDIFMNCTERDIEKFCKLCLLEKWLNNLQSNCSISDIDSVIININTNWLDKEINVSEGEGFRLTIARNLFRLINLNSSILIFDEPERGTDLYDKNCNDSYELVRRIVEEFSDKTIIIVSHNYDNNGKPHVKKVEEEKRNVQWDTIISLNSNGDTDMEVFVE